MDVTRNLWALTVTVAAIATAIAAGCAATTIDLAAPEPLRGVETKSPPERTPDRRYEACLLSKGFEPGGVQVLVDKGGAPWWIKTGRNVPADIHGPCFQKIGGTPSGLPSWG